jgi:hypothetical protein
VRDGHGDLRAEHIYLTDPAVTVDCIAFNERFRHVDTLDEVCFLATNLERMGRDDLAAYLVRKYREQMQDTAPIELEAFYRSYRCAVCAKVACLRSESQAGPAAEQSMAEATGHLEAGITALSEVHRPQLIVVCGMSGSGKSTIARELTNRLGAAHLASDVIRKELSGLASTDRSADSSVLYSQETSRKTYAALSERAEIRLRSDVSVVLDATYQHRSERDAIRKLASAIGVRCLFIECRCSHELAAARIRARAMEDVDATDADVSVLELQEGHFEPLTEMPSDELLVTETDAPVDELMTLIVSRLCVV